MKIYRLILVAFLCTVQLPLQAASAADVQEGEASYYADSLQGNKTASGEPYDKNAMTAAHRTLEFGTMVKVTYMKTGKSVEVEINDRGPHVKDRIIDLSKATAIHLGLAQRGTGRVRVTYLCPADLNG